MERSVSRHFFPQQVKTPHQRSRVFRETHITVGFNTAEFSAMLTARLLSGTVAGQLVTDDVKECIRELRTTVAQQLQVPRFKVRCGGWGGGKGLPVLLKWPKWCGLSRMRWWTRNTRGFRHHFLIATITGNLTVFAKVFCKGFVNLLVFWERLSHQTPKLESSPQSDQVKDLATTILQKSSSFFVQVSWNDPSSQ